MQSRHASLQLPWWLSFQALHAAARSHCSQWWSWYFVRKTLSYTCTYRQCTDSANSSDSNVNMVRQVWCWAPRSVNRAAGSIEEMKNLQKPTRSNIEAILLSCWTRFDVSESAALACSKDNVISLTISLIASCRHFLQPSTKLHQPSMRCVSVNSSK